MLRLARCIRCSAGGWRAVTRTCANLSGCQSCRHDINGLGWFSGTMFFSAKYRVLLQTSLKPILRRLELWDWATSSHERRKKPLLLWNHCHISPPFWTILNLWRNKLGQNWLPQTGMKSYVSPWEWVLIESYRSQQSHPFMAMWPWNEAAEKRHLFKVSGLKASVGSKKAPGPFGNIWESADSEDFKRSKHHVINPTENQPQCHHTWAVNIIHQWWVDGIEFILGFPGAWGENNGISSTARPTWKVLKSRRWDPTCPRYIGLVSGKI